MNLWNAHTFNLGSQGNIYTQTVIKLINGSCKLLVAALSRKVSCFDLSMTHSARPCGCVVRKDLFSYQLVIFLVLGIFTSGDFPSVQFPKRQLPKG